MRRFTMPRRTHHVSIMNLAQGEAEQGATGATGWRQGDERNKVERGGTACKALAQAVQSLFRVPAYS